MISTKSNNTRRVPRITPISLLRIRQRQSQGMDTFILQTFRSGILDNSSQRLEQLPREARLARYQGTCAERRGSVRMGSNSKKKPPTAMILGNESPRWRKADGTPPRAELRRGPKGKRSSVTRTRMIVTRRRSCPRRRCLKIGARSGPWRLLLARPSRSVVCVSKELFVVYLYFFRGWAGAGPGRFKRVGPRRGVARTGV